MHLGLSTVVTMVTVVAILRCLNHITLRILQKHLYTKLFIFCHVQFPTQLSDVAECLSLCMLQIPSPPSFCADLVDDDVDKAAMIILSNVSGISSVVGRQLTELTDAMKLLHGDGTAVDLLDILKRFFAHQILLQMRNELPLTTVSEEVTACVAEKIISEPLASTLADISAKLTQQLNTVFDIREIIIDLYHLAINLELESIPFTECVRSYAELHYCQVCVPLPGYAASRPCHNVCRNVMIGCSAFLHQYREAVKTKASEALALLEVVQMDSNGYQQAVNRVGEELQRLAESIEGQGANIIAQVCTRTALCLSLAGAVMCHSVTSTLTCILVSLLHTMHLASNSCLYMHDSPICIFPSSTWDI